ncbi:hypothetical protein SAMN05446935_7669 [Burkholderia sp. YR290]|nr:hypothetical protein SAMN05446935_7669 [Burkholderia sp. YR290]
MEEKARLRKAGTRRKAPACPPIGALMRYGERIVRVIAEASGQRVIIESVNEDGRTIRSAVKWANLAGLEIPEPAVQAHDVLTSVTSVGCSAPFFVGMGQPGYPDPFRTVARQRVHHAHADQDRQPHVQGGGHQAHGRKQCFRKRIPMAATRA